MLGLIRAKATDALPLRNSREKEDRATHRFQAGKDELPPHCRNRRRPHGPVEQRRAPGGAARDSLASRCPHHPETAKEWRNMVTVSFTPGPILRARDAQHAHIFGSETSRPGVGRGLLPTAELGLSNSCTDFFKHRSNCGKAVRHLSTCLGRSYRPRKSSAATSPGIAMPQRSSKPHALVHCNVLERSYLCSDC
ncbi:hypothetical protein SAMN04487976_109148 [Xaviernesmea oryzae]|nr:hypothetical protein SAMN04487976_109148 [Xaviernesmea oryzae]